MSVIYNALRKVQENERAPENFTGTGELPGAAAQSGGSAFKRFPLAMTGVGIVAVLALVGLQMTFSLGETEVGDTKSVEKATVLRGSDVAVLSVDKQGRPELVSEDRGVAPQPVSEEKLDEFALTKTQIAIAVEDQRIALEQIEARKERLAFERIAAEDERIAFERIAAEDERLVLERIAAEREALALERIAAEREALALERIMAQREALALERIAANDVRLAREQAAAVAAFAYEVDVLRPGYQRKQQESKRLKIGKVSQRLYKAIALNDEAAVISGFEDLHRLTSPNSTFSIKMQAFWSLKKGDNKQSRILLSEVLKRNPTDVDAGLNMAVIDIRANDFVRARTRLEELVITNPKHSAVLSLLEQLGR